MRDHAAVCARLFALAGATLYALLAFGFIIPLDYPHFATDLYDAYFYQLLDGRFDLPMRMLRYEGHYTADGTGFLYHGPAPLLTRALLYPFVALNDFPTAAFSIWLWAVVGTGFYHLGAFQVMQKLGAPSQGSLAVLWATMTAFAVWVCAPGILLSANTVLYHEPISIAFAATAAGVYLMLRCALFDMPPRYAVIPLALLVGVLLHSRPHLAVGLGAGLALLICISIWWGPKRPVFSAIGSIAILGVVALSFLQLNAARFGSATVFHGQMDAPQDANTVQYGPVFFGTGYATSGRGRAFIEHGRFHPWRVLPNIFVYTLDNPVAGNAIATMHRRMTEDVSGYGHIEAPRFGMLLLWPGWIIFAVSGLVLARPRISGGLMAIPLLLTTGIAAGLMLSYPTIAFRYRFELWPFLFALCLLSFPGLVKRFGPGIFANWRVLVLSISALIAGVLVTGRVIIPYAQSYEAVPGRYYGPWDAAHCLEMTSDLEFSPERQAKICIDPARIFLQ